MVGGMWRGFGVDVFRSIKVISDRKLNWIWEMLKLNKLPCLLHTSVQAFKYIKC